MIALWHIVGPLTWVYVTGRAIRMTTNTQRLSSFFLAFSISVLGLTACGSFISKQPDQPSSESAATSDGSMTSEEKNALVRQNMVIVQDAAEAYAAAHKGAYPDKIDLGFKTYFPGGDPQNKKPGKAPVNPFKNKREWPTPGSVEDISQIRAEYPSYMASGTIEYNLIGGTTYAIVGGASEEKRLPVLYRGTSGTLVLTNVTFATRIPRHLSTKLTIANKDEFGKVAGTSSLVGLDVKCLRATDADLENIAGSENIEKLDLSQTGITGAGLSSLADLSGLKSIDLSDTNIDGESLSALNSIPHLQRLVLQRTPVDDQTLTELSKFRDLREVDLRDTRINDMKLDAVKQMPKLESLYLCGHLSDESLAKLESVPSKLLVIEHSDLSAEAQKLLQQNNPKRKLTIQK